MIRLKIILHSKYFYIILFLMLIFYCIFSYLKPVKINTSIEDNKFTGIITNYKVDKELLSMEVKGKDKIIAYYYFKTEDEMESFNSNYNLGDKVLLKGSFSSPNNNTVFNLFNYKKYLRNKHIYLVMNCDNIIKLESNNNLIYKIKNIIINHINKYESKAYLETFILGDKNMIDDDIISKYQSNGISHLLAISGMHISLLSGLLLFLLKKTKLNDSYSLVLVSILLIIYMNIVSNTPSVSRSVLLFTLLTLNKIFKLELKLVNIFLITLFTVIILNPFTLFEVGFQYSFIVSFYLIILKDKLNDKSYLKKLLIISFISFSVSLPITLYNFYEVNFLSIILNILYVPFVSFIIFPLSLICLFLPFLDNILMSLINIFETTNILLSNINYFLFQFGRPNLLFIIIYYLFITLFFKTDRKQYLIIIILILIIFYNTNYLFSKNRIIFIDVGQGDSILISINNKNYLVDTGGKLSYKKEEWMRDKKSISDTKLIPMFKSFGIRKIDYLILTHGDYDHMGEAINLVNNFKVDKVIFNCGEFNELENELVKILDKKNMPYYSCIKELNFDNNKLYFLQTREYNNENDNSNVIYTEIDGYKFMFMGDAGVEKENDILEEYNISHIDVLKVGHHGSKTSSREYFINNINPKYSIISVGKNNRYGHPNKEVLNNLNNSKIYRTDQDGSIMFKIKNNKLKIETCGP